MVTAAAQKEKGYGQISLAGLQSLRSSQKSEFMSLSAN
jgi:hypothetical protein